MNSEFPKAITAQRKLRKLSQKQAAADLGISQALLSHYEKGIRECGLDFVVKIADYYNVSCDVLLGRSSGNDENIKSNTVSDNVEIIKNTAETLLLACKNTNDKDFEKEIYDYIMLNFYKLFRMIHEKSDNNSLFSIPQIPAENLADSVIMNLCASIKLKSFNSPINITDKISDNSLEALIKTSENKITEFHNFYHSR